MNYQLDQNLSWLQNFYFKTTKTEFINIPTITDEEALNSKTFENISIIPGRFQIYNVDNPGWTLEFIHNNTQYYSTAWKHVSINLDNNENEWLFLNKKENIWDAGSGPLYLSLCLEAFRYWIEGIPFHIEDLTKAREQLKPYNPLLCWLEEFYLSCCNGDWEHLCGYRLISTHSGWVVALSVEDLVDLDDKPFERVFIEEPEGTIECYKKDFNIIIRTHHRGLIKGLTIFKNWVDEVEMWRIPAE